MVETTSKQGDFLGYATYDKPSTISNWFLDIVISGILTQRQIRVFAWFYRESRLMQSIVQRYGTNYGHSHAEIAKAVGLSRTHVTSAISALKSKRLLFAFSTGRRTPNRYVVLFTPVSIIKMHQRIVEELQISLIEINPKWIFSKVQIALKDNFCFLRPFVSSGDLTTLAYFEYQKNIIPHVSQSEFDSWEAVKKMVPEYLENEVKKHCELSTKRYRERYRIGYQLGTESGTTTGQNGYNSTKKRPINTDHDAPTEITDYTDIITMINQNCRGRNVKERVAREFFDKVATYSVAEVYRACRPLLEGTENIDRGWSFFGKWIEKRLWALKLKDFEADKEKNRAKAHNLTHGIISSFNEGLREARKHDLSEPLPLPLETLSFFEKIGFDPAAAFDLYMANARNGILEGFEAEIYNKTINKFKL